MTMGILKDILKNGEFNPELKQFELAIGQQSPSGRQRVATVSIRQVSIIRENLLCGAKWNVASPVLPIDREDAAYILNTPLRDLLS